MKIRLIGIALVAALFTGCLGGSSFLGGTAEVGVYMAKTTSPVESLSALGLEGPEVDGEVEAVWVTVTGVHAKRDGTWDRKLFDVPQDQQLINLMDLHFDPELLGEGRLPAGTYTEFRFQLKENDEASGVLHNYLVVNGAKVPLKVPSNEIKPEIDIAIAKGAMVQLVFDVDPENFVDRNTGSISNPRKMLKFVGLLEDEFGSIVGKLELPDWITEGTLSIDLHLFREGTDEPVWTASLEDNILIFEIESLLKGSYRLEATVEVVGLPETTLCAGPFTIEAGIEKSITLKLEPLPLN